MDCGNCGTRNPRGNQFCVKCGARLAVAPAEPSQARPAPDPSRAQQLLEQAFRYSDQGMLDEAIEACRSATIANPASTSAHSFLGILYERAGEREKAIREYELALSLSPESVAERESLKQLASETGAPVGLPRISRRAARNALVGGFVVVVVAVVGAILLIGNRGRQAELNLQPHYPYPTPGAAPATAPAPTREEAAAPPAAAPPVETGYPMIRSPLQPTGPAYTLPPPGPPQPVPAPKPARVSLPVTGRVVEWRPPTALAAPPARNLAPAPPAAETAGEALVAAPQVARSYYFGRQYNEAIQIYERMLRLRPDGAAEIREELAWVYYQADRTRDAIAEYGQALDGYQRQLERGAEPEQAKLGIRTCRAAVEALSARMTRR